MRNFLAVNWYKLALAFSLVTFSSGFFIYAIKGNAVHASPPYVREMVPETNYPHVVALPDGKVFGIYRDNFNRWKADYLTDAR